MRGRNMRGGTVLFIHTVSQHARVHGHTLTPTHTHTPTHTLRWLSSQWTWPSAGGKSSVKPCSLTSRSMVELLNHPQNKTAWPHLRSLSIRWPFCVDKLYWISIGCHRQLASFSKMSLRIITLSFNCIYKLRWSNQKHIPCRSGGICVRICRMSTESEWKAHLNSGLVNN